jgi:hypothetical protein
MILPLIVMPSIVAEVMKAIQFAKITKRTAS